MPQWDGKNLLCSDGQPYPKVQILTVEKREDAIRLPFGFC